MGSDDAAASFIGELRLLPPVKTAYKPVEAPQKTALVPSSGDRDRDRDECVTPTSEKHRLKPATVCPPAPIKRRPVKRPAEAKVFFPVPCDLTSIFTTLPPKKRIRLV